MKIISTQYTLKYKSFEIAVSGCHGYCKGCHSLETWNFDLGENYKEFLPKIKDKIKEASDLIDWIWIYGGEPLDNNLDDLIDLLKQIHSKPIMLFTHYSLEEVPEEIVELCDYIKCGAYIEELKCEDNIQYGVKLATSNQKIYKIK